MRMRLASHVASIGDMRNAYKISSENLKKISLVTREDINKQIFQKWNVGIWNGLNWLGKVHSRCLVSTAMGQRVHKSWEFCGQRSNHWLLKDRCSIKLVSATQWNGRCNTQSGEKLRLRKLS